MSHAATRARAPSRRLRGAAVLQIIPALRDDPVGRAALNVVSALRQIGARAIVASEGGSLEKELHTLGGEWLPMRNATRNPLRLRRNARFLERYIATERIDIVHAYDAGAAWSALAGTERLAVWLVTNLPSIPAELTRMRAFYLSALGRGDRVLVHSTFTAASMIARYKIPPEQITVIPHSIDPDIFNPGAVQPDRVAQVRKAWKIPPSERIVFAPGPITPANGQIVLVDAARLIAESGMQGVHFVFGGDRNEEDRYFRAILRRARDQQVEGLIRLVGPTIDLPAAIAASDLVAMPTLKPPFFGRPAPEAQAMARPVVASAIGILPENIVAPPRMPDELRTGWLVPPGDPRAFAKAIHAILTLDIVGYRALAARARQFADFMFVPKSIAAATLAVYGSLLEGEG